MRYPGPFLVGMIACATLGACQQDVDQLKYDFDHDGWPDDQDCAPEDPAIYPGATEVKCDGIDNDCNAHTLDSPDSDGDGVGVCEDCDDSHPLTYPGAPEQCDSLDNDCDGAPNDDETDADGDGYRPCNVDTPDCDDSDPAVHPDAEEICNDWIDNDCDGTSNDCELRGVLSVTTADVTFVPDVEIQWAGLRVRPGGDLDGDGHGDLLMGSYVDDTNGEEAGAVYLFYGPPAGDQVPLSTADTIFVGEAAGDGAGIGFDTVGDTDGDGIDDLVIGAKYHDGAGSNAGAIYIIQWPVLGMVDLGTAQTRYDGEAPEDNAGRAVSGIGDVDGNGFADVLVSAPYGGDDGQGRIYLLLGPHSGAGSLAQAAEMFTGETPGDLAGNGISGGDFNGDGEPDLLVGAPRWSDGPGAWDVGALYVVYGPLGGSSLADADARLVGEVQAAWAGLAVANAGDVDGDGADEILVSAPWDSDAGTDAGAVYLILESPSGFDTLTSAAQKIVAEEAGSQVGMDIYGAGDINRDGVADLLIGSPYTSTAQSKVGKVYLIYGPDFPETDTSQSGASFQGESMEDYVGWSTARAGDVNGDGLEDFLIGAPGYDSGLGIIYLFYGMGL